MTKVNQSEINDVAWRACDTFRGVVDAENYRNYILVMLFWKYMSDVWRDHRQAYLREYDGDEARVARRLSRERFQRSRRRPSRIGVRHGMRTVVRGNRYGLGIVFHLAE